MKSPLFFSAMVCSLMLSACGQSETAKPANQAASTAQSNEKVYRVATDATYPPFEFTNERGDFIGLDIDLLNAIAEKQGFRVEYYHHGWDGMFDELKNGKADILASAIAVTDEAKENAALSESYFATPYAVVALNADYLKDNQWKKKRIIVGSNDDMQEILTEEHNVAAQQIQTADTLYLGLTDLVQGKADVVAGDATVMRYRINSPTFTNANIKFSLQDLTSAEPENDKLVFAVKQGNTELLTKINVGLAQLKQSGELNTILQKWSVNK